MEQATQLHLFGFCNHAGVRVSVCVISSAFACFRVARSFGASRT